MLLENKNAVIYGGGGAIGGAVVRAFVREGRGTFLDPMRPGRHRRVLRRDRVRADDALC